MSIAEIEAVLAAWPDLEYRGFVVPPSGETEKQGASRRRLAREELLDPVVTRQFSLCKEFVRRLGSEDPHGELVGSVELKRHLERWFLSHGDIVYTCQGVVIVSMISGGFTPRVITQPTCCFMVSAARLTVLARVSVLPTGPCRSSTWIG